MGFSGVQRKEGEAIGVNREGFLPASTPPLKSQPHFPGSFSSARAVSNGFLWKCLLMFSFFSAQRMVTMEDLPEVALVEILSLVPRRDLILNCRLVCSQWRDLVDLPGLWKRKCQQMGFYPETSDETSQDWRTFCFLKCNRNIIKNPCGEEGLYFWQLGWNGWTTTSEIMPSRRPPPDGNYFYRPYQQMPHPPQDIQSCFVFTSSSNYSSESFFKNQLICLLGKGYSDEEMDEIRPIIRVKDWHFPNHELDSRLIVRLVSEDFKILQECCLQVEAFNCWNELSYTFDNYPPGVRTISLEQEGRAQKYMITGTSITLDPEERVPQPPTPLKKPSFSSRFHSLLQFLKRKKNTS